MTLATPDSTTEWTIERDIAAKVIGRDARIDSMRGIAILMVIGIHSLPQIPNSPAWGTIVDAALRPCVPIFLFVSGYMSAKSHRIPILRRLQAALIPYAIAFTGAYLYMALHNANMDHRLPVTLARFGLAYVFVYYYVFVYVGCTICLWLLFKLFSPEIDDGRRLAAASLMAIGFGLIAGAYMDPLVGRLGYAPALVEEVRMRDIPFWFSFVALGLFFGMARGDTTIRAMKIMIVTATSVAYLLYTAVRLWQIGDAADYDSIAFFVYAAALCLLIPAFGPSSTLLASIGSGSYFVYLWHIFIIMALRDHAYLQMLDPLASFVLTFTITSACIVTALLTLRRVAPPALTRWLGA